MRDADVSTTNCLIDGLLEFDDRRPVATAVNHSRYDNVCTGLKVIYAILYVHAYVLAKRP